jgi:phosphoribosylformimino-5-aminoimidazole carboxamide ribotide isomerase
MPTIPSMDVVPVIDLKNGVVVHARQGRRDAYQPIATPLSLSSRPEDVVGGLLRLHPFRRIYVADLDAIERRGSHAAVLAILAARHPELEFWVDDGTADAALARAWHASHAGALVIGSESQTDASILDVAREDPRMILSLDFRGDAFQGPPEILEHPETWPARVIVMTLARVGAAAGPDLGRVAGTVKRAGNRQVYAAGGVRNGDDLRALADAGAAGVLVATALHAGTVTRQDLKDIA